MKRILKKFLLFIVMIVYIPINLVGKFFTWLDTLERNSNE